ncbi:MAG: class I tRNA ligase family protein, partial [Gammaproteobacteria bacterium]|nr:class I tRNA ligase family protein [Gammaproteobacteria bacterium]
TSGMMQPQLAKKIERATRTDFPQGIPSYGTDALRFTFAALATTGRDIKFDLGRIEGYRNFCNKLWNACRFVLMNTDGEDCGSALTARDPGVVRSVADRWIISRMQSTISDTTEAIENYRFDQAAKAIYEFTWNEYCDWYLELCKPVLNGDTASPQARRGARQTLVRVLETLLRLIHPIMPFISEEVWQQVAPLAGINGATIMTQPYPRVDANWIDQAAVDEMEWVMNFTLGVRRIKGEMNIPPGKPLPVLLQHASERDLRLLGENRHYLDALARLASVEVLAGDQPAPDAATALVGEMKVLIPMAGLIDKEAELSRLRKETEKISGEVERLEKKLANPHFVEKAPEKVVRKEQEKLTAQRSARLKLEEQIEKITKL